MNRKRTSPRPGLRVLLFCGALLGAALWPARVSAHADLLMLIDLVNEAMRTNGATAGRLLERADLNRLHQDWPAALRDYAAAEKGLGNSVQLAQGRALVLVACGKPSEARQVYDEQLRRCPTNAPLLLDRARVLAQLNQPALAIADYTLAFANTAQPRTKDYLERAQLQVAMADPAAAVKGLDEGLARLGWTLTLQRLAVDCAVASGDFGGALARLETILERANRKENWLALKGGILQRAGRKPEALAAYQAGLEAIAELPPQLARAQITVSLRAQLDSAVRELKAGTTR